jgi:short-subunit dehydrogenase
VLPQLQKYDFSILVNNAGVDKLDLHQKFTLAEVFNHININCLAVCALTYKFSKLFKDKIKRTGKKCAIINVASIAGGNPEKI